MAAADQALLDQIQRLSGTCISLPNAGRSLTGIQARYGRLAMDQQWEAASRTAHISTPEVEVEEDTNITSLRL
jgi:hypothetical protein